MLRSDNSLVSPAVNYSQLVRSYSLKQVFITPHCLQENGMVERLIRITEGAVRAPSSV